MRLIDADALLEKYNVKDVTMAECLTDTKMAKSFEKFCIISDAVEDAPTVDAVPVCVLKEILMRYFGIGDSYHFELTRVKEAFAVGAMKLDDFQEWTEENVDDLVDYIKKNCADGERKGGDD